MKIKFCVVFVMAISVGGSLVAADMSPNYFCADMMPQQHVNIEQLTGMWYAIEIIPHNLEEHHYVITEPSCPIIHISEERYYPTTTYNPLYKNYGYDYNYGERRPGNHNYGERRDYNLNQRDRDYNRRIQDRNYNDRNRYNDRQYPIVVQGQFPKNQDPDYNTAPTRRQPGQEYYGRTTPGYDDFYTRRYGSTMSGYLPRYPVPDMRKLRIWWDENGTGTEYQVRYNVTRPGFWMSSGPQNGSELEPQYSHFAGTIQVIKAVGNHLVLNFCHQMPDRRLFTVILSREYKLDVADIRGVHSLLNRKGLSTASIKRVCSKATTAHHHQPFLILSSLVLVGLVLKFSHVESS